jgi:hypothetical protein
MAAAAQSDITIPESQQLQNSVASITRLAESFAVITTNEHMLQATEILKGLAAVKRNIEETMEPHVASAHKTWKGLTALRARFLEPVEQKIAVLKSGIGRFQQEQERLRRAEEERLAAEARRAQEEEAQAEAARLEAEGNHAEAEAVIEEAIAAPAPVVIAPSTVPKVEGIVSRGTWKFRIKNPSQIKREYLKPDEVKIGQVVRAMKKQAEEMIGGVEVWEEKNIAVKV